MENFKDPLFTLSVGDFNENLRSNLSDIVGEILDEKLEANSIKRIENATMNIDEAALLLKVSKQTIYQNISRIPHRKIFGRLVFIRTELLEFIDNNGKMPERNKGSP